MKRVLPKLIDANQFAFLGERNMLDSVLIVNEVKDEAKTKKIPTLIFHPYHNGISVRVPSQKASNDITRATNKIKRNKIKKAQINKRQSLIRVLK